MEVEQVKKGIMADAVVFTTGRWMDGSGEKLGSDLLPRFHGIGEDLLP